MVDAKFYEVTSQIALTSHLVDLNYVAFSKAVWDGLTPEQQVIVQDAAGAASESGRQKQLVKEAELVGLPRGPGARDLRTGSDGFPRTRPGTICRVGIRSVLA